jgi:hypothetical protein
LDIHKLLHGAIDVMLDVMYNQRYLGLGALIARIALASLWHQLLEPPSARGESALEAVKSFKENPVQTRTPSNNYPDSHLRAAQH